MATVDRGDAQVWWDAEGDGPPVLLLSGLSSPSDLMHRIRPHLAARHRVVVIDNRGVGRTGVPAAPFSIEMMAADAVAVLDAAGIDRAHVVGLSMGGLIAQELALSFPDRLASLTLAATFGGASSLVPGDPEALTVLGNAAGLPQPELQRAIIPFTYSSTTPPERIDEDLALRARHPSDPAGVALQAGAAFTFDRWADLPGIAAPTLVVHGKDDRLIAPANGEKLAGAIPGARLVLLDRASHQLFTDQEDQLAELILSFLADADADADADGA